MSAYRKLATPPSHHKIVQNVVKKPAIPGKNVPLKQEVSGSAFHQIVYCNAAQQDSPLANKLTGCKGGRLLIDDSVSTKVVVKELEVDYSPNPNCGVLYITVNTLLEPIEKILPKLDALMKVQYLSHNYYFSHHYW